MSGGRLIFLAVQGSMWAKPGSESPIGTLLPQPFCCTCSVINWSTNTTTSLHARVGRDLGPGGHFDRLRGE